MVGVWKFTIVFYKLEMKMGRGSDGDEDLYKRGVLALDRDGIMKKVEQEVEVLLR